MLRRLFPVRLDNGGYCGRAAALWLFAVFLVLKTIMGVKGAINTRSVATGADGIRLEGLDDGTVYTILSLFRSLSLAQLPVVAIGALALWRWRGMVPLLYVVVLGDQFVRRLATQGNTVARTDAPAIGMWISVGILALLFVGLVLSLWSRPTSPQPLPVL